MKCAKCGTVLPKKEKICPNCHHDNGWLKHLKDATIPSELDHLSLHQLEKKMHRQHLLRENKKYVLLFLLLLVLALGIYKWPKKSETIIKVHNFHDDLIDNITSNATGNSISNIANHGILAVDGNRMYAYSDDGIYDISLALDHKELLINKQIIDINVAEAGIYFISETDDDQIMYYDFKTKQVMPLNLKAKQLYLVGSYLYYLDNEKHSAVIQYRIDTNESKVMTQGDCLLFNIFGNNLYYTTSEGLFSCPLLGGDIVKVAEGHFSRFSIFGQFMYYLSLRDGLVYRMKLGENEPVPLIKDKIEQYILTRDYLYYVKSGGGIFKYRLDNGNTSQLTSDRAKDIQIAGSWIYYLLTDRSNEGRFISVDENSHETIPVYTIE